MSGMLRYNSRDEGLGCRQDRLRQVLHLLTVASISAVAYAQVPQSGSQYPLSDHSEPVYASQSRRTGHKSQDSPEQLSQEALGTILDEDHTPHPFAYSYGALARGYYMNDQRIQWSGQEATFGAEGALQGQVSHISGHWEAGLLGEFFLNLPYDRNRLRGPDERTSYLDNFEVDTFEISQLCLSIRREQWMVNVGKFVTPFGRYYLPMYTNRLIDAPFIRSESIKWRETGAMIYYDPKPLVVTLGLVNGSENMDTNSSKALVSRIGVDYDSFSLGASVKYQDGIGSEQQKTTNNHVGVDAMYRWGPWILSGETIYDEYGFRRDYDPNSITWGRSIYYRDRYAPGHTPITGWGYYGNLTYQGQQWTWVFNYGEYYPEQIGDRLHDAVSRRGIVKGIYRFSTHLEGYMMVIVENDLPNSQLGRNRQGLALWAGLQYSL